jgi:8-oxo-dGTP diphosphatase
MPGLRGIAVQANGETYFCRNLRGGGCSSWLGKRGNTDERALKRLTEELFLAFEMARLKKKVRRIAPTKEVSVMAWVQDSFQRVLFVRQVTGLKLWTLPGGKVKRGESLINALKREVYEESGLRVEIGTLLMVLDWHDKDAIALLFSVVLEKGPFKVQQKTREINKTSFRGIFTEEIIAGCRIFLVCPEMSYE